MQRSSLDATPKDQAATLRKMADDDRVVPLRFRRERAISISGGKGGVGKSTIAVNLAGIPGISVPAGFAGGRPVGLQILGTHFAEAQLLNVAHQFQQATDWHLQLPAFAEENA